MENTKTLSYKGYNDSDIVDVLYKVYPKIFNKIIDYLDEE